MLEAIHRDPSSIAELGAKLDPIVSATLLILWHQVKEVMVATVLGGIPIVLDAPSYSLPKRGKICGEGRVVQRVLDAENAEA